MTLWLLTGYWLLVLAAGAATVGLVPVAWRWPERMALTLVVGLVTSTLTSFLIAFGPGVSVASALGGPAAVLGLAVGLARRLGARPWDPWVRAIRRAVACARGAPLPTLEVGTGLVLLLLGAGLLLVMQRALMAGPGGTFTTGFDPTWDDWSVHVSYVQYFALSHRWPPTDALAAGQVLRYPFMADLQSAFLRVLGEGLASALVLPSWLVSWAATVLVWSVGRRMLGSRLAGTVAVLLVLLGGGLGFARLYPDTCRTETPRIAGAAALVSAGACSGLATASPSTLDAVVRGLPAILTRLPRSYDGSPGLAGGTAPPFPDIQLYTPLILYWLAQRDFDYGVALLAAVLLGGWLALQERRRALALGTGVLGAALSFFSPYAWIAAVVIAVGWLALIRRREAGLLLLPLLFLGLPCAVFDAAGPHGQLIGPLGSNLFPVLQLGWLSTLGTVCTAAQWHAGISCAGLYLHGLGPTTLIAYVVATLAGGSFWANLVHFWLINTGAFIPLAAAAAGLALMARRRRRPLAALPCGVVRFCAPAFLLFVLVNLVALQPFGWDDTKLVADWILLASFPVAALLAAGLRRRWARVPAAVVMVTLVASSVLAIVRAMPGQGPPAGGGPAPTSSIGIAGPTEVLVARRLRRRIPPGALVLTEGELTDPVTVLAGHPVVLAYAGWLWSYGDLLSRPLREVQAMYAGCPPRAHPCRALALLHRDHVGYVELEPGDYNGIAVNTAWFARAHFSVVVQVGPYTIYRVPRD